MIAAAGVALAAMCSSASAATIYVTTQSDDGNGGFDEAGCSLREAVQAANDNAAYSLCPGDSGGGTGADTIILESGLTYTLSKYGASEDDNAFGDLDIDGGGGTTIQANGSGLATIDGYGLIAPSESRDRVLEVLPAAGPVTLSRLRIQNGFERSGTIVGNGGGGIHNQATLNVIDSEIANNTATDAVSNGAPYVRGGGILNEDDGILTLTRTTVAANTAHDVVDGESQGGGIANLDGTLTATNTTISGNVAKEDPDGFWDPLGGGIWQESGTGTTMTLTNVTITANSVTSPEPAGEGGAFYIDGVGASDTIGGTIIAGNTAPGFDECAANAPAGHAQFYSSDNVIGNPAGCTRLGGANDLVNASANLGPLQNYGGPTRTHILNAGSPAINHGGSCPATDQRGYFRFNALPCDTGALELGASPTPPPEPPPAPPATTGPTGQRAAALKKCKKKRSKKARKKCKKRALQLPV